jgi:hypothetical protein
MSVAPATTTADDNSSNGYRARVWKAELQRLADKLGISIRVSHFPPGTSKWNKIEHRMFSFISINWRGRPLRTHEIVVNLIANTTNCSDLVVRAQLDRRKYPTGKKISAKEFRAMKSRRTSSMVSGTTSSDHVRRRVARRLIHSRALSGYVQVSRSRSHNGAIATHSMVTAGGASQRIPCSPQSW